MATSYNTLYRLYRRLATFFRSLKSSCLYIILAFLKKCNLKSCAQLTHTTIHLPHSRKSHSNQEASELAALASLQPPDMFSTIPEPAELVPRVPEVSSLSQHVSQEILESSGLIRCVPRVASDVQRYHKNVFLESRSIKVIIPAGTLQFPNPPAPSGWEARVHPNGALYFVNERFVTEANLYQSTTFASINACAQHLWNTAGDLMLHITDDVQVMLQLASLDGERVCGYYFVNHATRALFWIEEMPANNLSNGVEGLKYLHQFRYAIEAEYWRHCELYPLATVNRDQIRELKGLLLVACTVNLTSTTSLSPFNGKELKYILDLMPNIEATSDEYDSHYTWVIARVMEYFARAKFLNFCGQPFARLDANQSVYYSRKGSGWIGTIISWCINFILFGGPHAYMPELRKIWVDHTVNYIHWKDFNERLTRQWSSLALYAMIMLGSDIGFQVLPVISNRANYLTSQIAIIAIELSTYCTIGSLLVSMLLARRVQKDGRRSATETVEYIFKPFFGIHIMAGISIIYSLPHAMLMWGLCLFVVAFSAILSEMTSTVAVVVVYSIFVFISVSILMFLTKVYGRQVVDLSQLLSRPVYALYRLVHLRARTSPLASNA
ncbi:uncharacterized protein EDB91DRAFT_1150337 [Suillus paluster]|uniref:uncharacterized protein n=1 Tax=Suillus paluster TaxID=48578 RepID=UPI001B87ADB8|nr:uncharacterized protein EDB91DRAFT_1150337 [Suillus paluster]KAG1733071.1 hypothetical protein EDB91DRAFT_1150337 [Suillus paluster]